jgi:hypothetical protein
MSGLNAARGDPVFPIDSDLDLGKANPNVAVPGLAIARYRVAPKMKLIGDCEPMPDPSWPAGGSLLAVAANKLSGTSQWREAVAPNCWLRTSMAGLLP